MRTVCGGGPVTRKEASRKARAARRRVVLSERTLARWRADTEGRDPRVCGLLARAVRAGRYRWLVEVTPDEAQVLRESADYWAWSYEGVSSREAQRHAARMRSVAWDLGD